MQIKSGVEQAICILVMLATQHHGDAVTSDTISERLDVSPSFLKKIMRMLVVKNIITSTSGKNGGFQLAKDVDDIDLLEVFEAIEGVNPFLKTTNLVQHIFSDQGTAAVGETIMKQAFANAERSYRAELANYSLGVLLRETFRVDNLQQFDWNGARRT
ncbi:Rrf2 family transcriptional regulator [Paenibacillus thiaminolyticus]|uniref:Rrf2 family transcriptional regulator n=1 Tax=Paenibacillus thiaminolyticus TaxID=49283 RepID=A0AAP9E0Z0_PANTH|nr:Rrf2 family transcriptional regulator [Paenibacillus thiaminolyticus]MCY9533834.1 Rrf2 family transcriptional regulator [Paenibacillus thiaminolyticus]MCY9601797.1 Rrf2 family transcriptional regulator [Paenibacillus thiaminolyticus]MCY9607071.1 Rrf2 family transcriptional regulator [Paenibacillus thiaminolyticus]MCY9614241.1 Rrf2 family transcriptional regulator [Paenibacillus thiaminolyticus]MCY9619202.1 Rrf2 family transcriptional regulator [Paenibacillus thiaminolyticus]